MANPLSIFKRKPATSTSKKAAGGNTVSVSSDGTRKVTNKYGVTTTFHKGGLQTSSGRGSKPAETPASAPSTSRSGPTKRYKNTPAKAAPKASPAPAKSSPRPITRPDGGGGPASKPTPPGTSPRSAKPVGGAARGSARPAPAPRKLGITDYGPTQVKGPGRRFPNGPTGRAAEKAAGWSVGRNAKKNYGGVVSSDSTMGRYIKRQQGKKRT